MASGNYSNYYGSRDGDSRLDCLKQDWFMGKRVLDIGCNAGAVSLEIANRFQPASVLGIDSDDQLISKAFVRSSLLNSCRRPLMRPFNCCTTAKYGPLLVPGWESDPRESPAEGPRDIFPQFPISMPLLFGTVPLNIPKTLFRNSLEHGIDFVALDVMKEDPRLADCSFDVIICFSITKWIHLNHGDEGILWLFRKIYRLLSPGGRLLVEPQSWRSYLSASGSADDRTINLQLRPFISGDERDNEVSETFSWHLVHSIGFKSPGHVLRRPSSSGDEFSNRPIWMFEK